MILISGGKMFAICSVQEFKPEKVTVNSNPDKTNTPVNLNHVRVFYKSVRFVFGAKDKNYPTICFEFNSTECAVWYFHSQEDCNEEYQKLLYKITKPTEKS